MHHVPVGVYVWWWPLVHLGDVSPQAIWWLVEAIYLKCLPAPNSCNVW